MSIAIPLPYAAIKEIHNSNTSINPFFGRWSHGTTPPSSLASYRWILDITTNARYERPQIRTENTLYFAPYFVTATGSQVTHPTFLPDSIFTHANTQENPILIVSTPSMTTTELAAAAYALFLTGHSASETALTPSDKQVHWVWFRKPGYRLTTEILERAASWIECNAADGFQFHLWTNLLDATECDDFLGDIPSSLQERYLPQIQVHYSAEFYATIRGWIQTYCSAETHAIFERVWHSTERQDIIMKTDYTRNILLAIHGGIYADFNDLLCLAPVTPFLRVHAGSYVGVTDTNADSHASNYFLYASQGNPEWNTLVIRCTETLPAVYSVIYDTESLSVARTLLQAVLEHGLSPNMATIQAQLSRVDFPHTKPQHFVYAMAMALGITVPSLNSQITSLLQRPNKPQFIASIVSLLAGRSDLLATLTSDEFVAAWRYARTDMYMSWIMYHSNLPIFCRQMKIPIPMVPFGYLLRYACLLSFIGHLGDGTSYGRPPSQKITMRRLLNVT